MEGQLSCVECSPLARSPLRRRSLAPRRRATRGRRHRAVWRSLAQSSDHSAATRPPPSTVASGRAKLEAEYAVSSSDWRSSGHRCIQMDSAFRSMLRVHATPLSFVFFRPRCRCIHDVGGQISRRHLRCRRRRRRALLRLARRRPPAADRRGAPVRLPLEEGFVVALLLVPPPPLLPAPRRALLRAAAALCRPQPRPGRRRSDAHLAHASRALSRTPPAISRTSPAIFFDLPHTSPAAETRP